MTIPLVYFAGYDCDPNRSAARQQRLERLLGEPILGYDKLLREISPGKSMVKLVVGQAIASNCFSPIILLGSQDDYEDMQLDCRVVDVEGGLVEKITAIQELFPDQMIALAAADIPYVESHHYQQLVNQFKSALKYADLVVPLVEADDSLPEYASKVKGRIRPTGGGKLHRVLYSNMFFVNPGKIPPNIIPLVEYYYNSLSGRGTASKLILTASQFVRSKPSISSIYIVGQSFYLYFTTLLDTVFLDITLSDAIGMKVWTDLTTISEFALDVDTEREFKLASQKLGQK